MPPRRGQGGSRSPEPLLVLLVDVLVVQPRARVLAVNPTLGEESGGSG